jgi:hypothetical protein
VAVGKEFAGTFAVAEALKNDGAKSQGQGGISRVALLPLGRGC